MAVSSEIAEVAYAGNGTQTVFAVPFYFLANADLRVTLVVDATGSEQALVLGLQYTASGAGSTSGGSITMVIAPPTGQTLVIERGIALTQTTTFQRRDPFDAQTVNTDLDRARMVDQRLKARIDRSLRVPLSESAAAVIPSVVARKGRIFGYDATTGAPFAVGTAALIPDMESALINASASIERVLQIDNVTALKALAKPAAPVQANLRGYYVAEDDGGGPVSWDPSSTDTADDVEIFAPDAGGAGRWKRILEGPVTTAMAGVKDDDIVTGPGTWRGIHAAGRRKRTIRFGGGVNRITEFDEYNATSLTVEGEGRGWTTLAPIGDFQTSGSAEANVLYAPELNDVTVRGLTIAGGDAEAVNSRYRGIFFPNAKKALITDVAVHSCGGLRTSPTGQGIVFTYCEDLTIRDVWVSGVAWDAAVPNPDLYVATAPDATLTPSATTGAGVTFTASAGVFVSGDVGKKITSGNGYATITGYSSATEVTATISSAFASTSAIASGSWALVTYDGDLAFWGTRELVVIGRQCKKVLIDGLHLKNPRDTALLISAGPLNAEIDLPQDITVNNLFIDASGLPLVDSNGSAVSASYGVDGFIVGSGTISHVKVRADGRLKNGIYLHDVTALRSGSISTSHCRLYGLNTTGIRINGSTTYTSVDDWVDGAGPEDAPLTGNQGIVATATNSTIIGAQVKNTGLSGIVSRAGRLANCRVEDWDRSGTGTPAIGVLQKADSRLHVSGLKLEISDAGTFTPAGAGSPITTPDRAIIDLLDDTSIKQREIDVDGVEANGTGIYWKQIDPTYFTATVGFMRGRNIFIDSQVLPTAGRILGTDTTIDVRGYEVVEMICSGAVTITNIIASPGQTVTLLGGNGNATLGTGGNIVLQQGGSLNIPSDGSVTLVYRKTSTVDKMIEAGRAVPLTVRVPAYISDLRSATAEVITVRAPITGRVGPVGSTMGGALATANATIQGRRKGGADFTNLLLTLALSGSGSGVADKANSSGANTVTEGDLLEFAVGGGNTADVDAHLTVEFIY